MGNGIWGREERQPVDQNTLQVTLHRTSRRMGERGVYSVRYACRKMELVLKQCRGWDVVVNFACALPLDQLKFRVEGEKRVKDSDPDTLSIHYFVQLSVLHFHFHFEALDS